MLDANRQHAIGSKFHRIAGHVLCLDIHMFESLNRVVNLRYRQATFLTLNFVSIWL